MMSLSAVLPVMSLVQMVGDSRCFLCTPDFTVFFFFRN